VRSRLALGLAALAAACGDDDAACVPATSAGCAAGLVCEVVEGRDAPACLPPVVVRGTVRDASNDNPIAGARVLAVGEDGSALAPAATTVAAGGYELRVPADRDASLAPRSRRLSITASAPGFGTSPHPWRERVLVDLAGAQPTAQDGKRVLASADTDAALIAFTGGPGRGVIRGTVELPPGRGAVLVVAASEEDFGRPRGTAAWADSDGNYTIVDLPPAELSVRAYARGASYGERRVGLNVGEETTLDLRLDPAVAAVTVSGRVEVAGGGTPEVALVVASTHDPRTAAGEDLGLRASARADGGYSFTGVPAGSYRVISRAVDGLVAVGAAPEVSVAGEDVEVGDRLRLVPALAVLSPGAQGLEGTGPAPALSWMDDDAEARYQVRVINLAGVEVFARSEPAHGGDDPSLLFQGSLVRGMVYRLTVEALDERGAVITRTEERRGLFFPNP
jgi:hypothetical protein